MTHRKQAACAAAVWGCVLFSAMPASPLAWEANWPPPTGEELLARAERIVVARCLSSQAKQEMGGIISTFVEFATLELVKGNLPAQFTLKLPGGRIGDVEQGIGGLELPQFTPDEEVILLLGSDNQDGYPLLMLGNTWVYRIVRDPTSGVRNVVEPPPIRLLKANTHAELFAAKPLNAQTCADRLNDPACIAAMVPRPEGWSVPTEQDFSEPVTVEDVVWSIRQALQQP